MRPKMQLNLGTADEPDNPLAKSHTPGEMNSASKKIDMQNFTSKTPRDYDTLEALKRKTVPI